MYFVCLGGCDGFIDNVMYFLCLGGCDGFIDNPPNQTKYITLSMKPSHSHKQTKYITLSMKPSHPP
jgi:hypothetical protein